MARFFRQWFRQAIANAMSYRASRRRRISAMTVMPKLLSLDLALEGRETPGSLLEGMLSALAGGVMSEPLAAVAAFDSSAFTPRVADVPVSLLEPSKSSETSSTSSNEVPAWLSDVQQYASRSSDVDTSSGDATGFVKVGVDDLPESGAVSLHLVQVADAQPEAHAGGSGEESLLNFRGSTSTDTSTPVWDVHEPQALMVFAPPASERTAVALSPEYGGKPYIQFPGRGVGKYPTAIQGDPRSNYDPSPRNQTDAYSINGTGVPAIYGTPSLDGTSETATEPMTISEAQSVLASTPLMFEQNVLQPGNGYDFIVRGSGRDGYIGATGAAFTVVDPVSAAGQIPPQGRDRKKDWQPSELKSSTVRLEIVGANPKAESTVGSELETQSHYLLGSEESAWISGVKNYDSVSYSEVLPGVGLKFYGSSQELAEYDFTVNPGTSPSSIRLRLSGAETLKLDDVGNLIAATASGNLTFHAPVSYQEGEKGRVEIKSAFRVDGDEVTFEVGDYDKSKPLVIDPTVLIYGSYTKSGTGDAVLGVAADAAGYVYLTGTTGVTGKYTAFLTKLSPDGKTALSTTFIGGKTSDPYTYDVGRGVTVDSSGYVYVVGETRSPTFASKYPLQSFNLGAPVKAPDAFATKLSTDAKTLVYSTPLGGTSADWANGVTVSTGGSMYIVGHTESPDLPLANPLQPDGSYLAGFQSGYAMRLSWNGSTSKLSTSFTTYLGGDGSEATGVARDASNNMYITGYSLSNPSVFYGLGFGSYSTLTTGAGLDWDAAFAMKLTLMSPPPPPGISPFSPTLGAFYGGGDYDYPTGIALDSSNNIYLSGLSASNNLPVTSNAWQDKLNQNVAGFGYTDGFFTEIAANMQSVLYSTYLGGQQDDRANSVSVNSAGQVFVGGESYFDTTDVNFKNMYRARSLQLPNGASNSKGTDGFVARFDYGSGDGDYPTLPPKSPPVPPIPIDPNGLNPKYVTPIGGASADKVLGVAAGTNGNVYVGGQTYSPNFPLNVPYSTAPNGGFAARIGYSKMTSSNFGIQTGVTAAPPLGQFTMSISYPSYTATIDWGDGTGTTAGSVTTSDGITYSVSGVNGSHAYTRRGVYTVTTTVYANDGTKIGTLTSTATISPVLPKAYAPAPSWDESAMVGADLVQTNSAIFGDLAQSPYSSSGVRYVDGQLRVTAVDIASDGFGSGWSLGRTWAGDGTYYSLGSGYGLTEKAGWVDASNPFILQSGTSIILFANGTTARWYDQSGGSWLPRVPDGSAITFDGTYYVLGDTMGHRVTFNPPTTQAMFGGYLITQPFYQIGAFQSQIDGDGFITQVTSRDTLGRQLEVTRTNGTTIEKYTTTYTAGDDASKSFKSLVVLSRSIAGGAYTTVRKVSYTYSGNQLTVASVQDGSGAEIEKSTYTYTGDQLTSVKSTRASLNVSQAADLTIAYTSGKVSSITPAGMSAITYTYATSANALGYNNWATKTTETLPDGNSNIIYTNGYGQVMLRSFKETSTGREWITYYHYNSNGQVDYKANPSAVIAYSDTYADLVNFVAGNAANLRDSAGLIETEVFSGLLKSSRGVKQGETGASVSQETWTFVSVPNAGGTFYALATDTLIPDPNNTLANRKTSYGYSWYSGTTQPQSIAVTAPDNGQRITWFDTLGRPVWVKDAGGFISYTEYDLATGGILKSITDVNTTLTSDFVGLPTGWTTPSGGGLHLKTTSVLDHLGRATSTTLPNGRVTTATYNDPGHSVTTNDGGPQRVSTTNYGTGQTESLSGASGKTVAVWDTAGRVATTKTYYDGTGFYASTLAYDTKMGRQTTTTDSASVTSETVYDALGRVVGSKKAGVLVTEYEYDNGGVGDGNVTKITVHPGNGQADRVTQTWYDWRNRSVFMKQGVETGTEDVNLNRPITYTSLNNLGEVTQVDTYDGDGITATVTGGVPVAPGATLLRGRSTSAYDAMGRVWSSAVVGVNPTTGATGASNGTSLAFDLRGNVTGSSTATGAWTLSTFDGAGRTAISYTTNNSSLASSTVLSQTEYNYDGNGNVLSTTSRERVDGQTGLGALGTPTTGVLARLSYTAMYYDNADRVTTTADYGTNNGAAWTRPTSAPTVSSSSVLVSKTSYDTNGFVEIATDPLGIQTKSTYDSRGFTKTVDQAFGTLEVWTTQYTTDTAGRLEKTILPGARTTKTGYDTFGRASTTITRDGTAIAATSTITFDNLGQAAKSTDANGIDTVSTYDILGRVTSTVEASGKSSARTTSYKYDTLGRQIEAKDSLNNVTTTIYNDHLRQQVSIDGVGKSWTTIFDANGNVVTSINPLSKTVASNHYDAWDRLVTSTDATGYVTGYSYNVSGDRDVVTDGRGYTTANKWDIFRRTIESIDGEGKSTLYTLDFGGRTTKMVDPVGVATDYTLDNLGRVTFTKVANGFAEGTTTETHYNSSGDVDYTKDAKGIPTTMTYDAGGRLFTSAIETLTTTYGYDLLDRTTTISAPGSRVTTNAYDELGHMKSSTLTAGTITQTSNYTFDSFGNTSTMTDPLGRVTKYSYDALNRQTSVTRAFGTADAVTTYTTYDDAGRVTTNKDALGYVTTYGYDDAGRQTTVTDPYGKVTTTAYDKNGNVTSVTDPTGVAVSKTYDKNNRVLTEYRTPNLVTETTNYTYDYNGNVLTVTDPRGYVTTNTYDKLNRLVTSKDPYNKITTTAYDLNGNVLSVTDPVGGSVAYVYDNLNRVTKQTDSFGKYKTFDFHPTGEQKSVTDETNKVTSYGIDDLGRQITVTKPGTGVTTTAYDVGNRVTTITGPNGELTTNSYDNLDRVVGVTVKLSATTSATTLYGYDANGNRTKVTDPVNNITQYTFDKRNNVLTETDPLNKVTTYTYDDAGRVLTVVDRLSREKVFAYDLAGRVKSETWKATVGGTVIDTKSYTFDASGNMTTASNGAGTYVFSYDRLNRVGSVSAPYGVTQTFGYDDVGNRTSVTDNLGGSQVNVYDKSHRLTSRTETVGSAVARLDFTYTDRNERATETRYSNAAGTVKVGSTEWTYKPDGMVDVLTMKGPTGTVLWTGSYIYDTSDRLTSKTENSVTTSYTYDFSGQMLSEGAKSYTYDLNGNRTMSGYVTIAGNRLQTDGTTTFVYNDMGEQTKATTISGGNNWNYVYDMAGHMTNATLKNSGGTNISVVNFKYDVFGNKVERAETGTYTITSRYAYDGYNPGNPGAGGNSKFDAVIDMDGLNAVTARHVFGDAVDDVQVRIAGGVVSWYGTDRQGSVRKVFDGAGAVINSVDYDAFGVMTAGSQIDRFGYTGRELDSTLGRIDYRDRIYDPYTGRFIRTDSLGFKAGDSNHFRYTGNGPVNAEDPSGMEPPKKKTTISTEKFRAPGKQSPPPQANPFRREYDPSKLQRPTAPPPVRPITAHGGKSLPEDPKPPVEPTKPYIPESKVTVSAFPKPLPPKTLAQLVPGGKIPEVNGGAFARWFDELSSDELKLILSDKEFKNTVARRVRHPGGFHEWMKVEHLQKIKEWGVPMSEIWRFRTKTTELVGTNPITGEKFVHTLENGRTGPGGKTFDNELSKITSESNSLSDFRERLRSFVKRWKIDDKLLPTDYPRTTEELGSTEGQVVKGQVAKGQVAKGQVAKGQVAKGQRVMPRAKVAVGRVGQAGSVLGLITMVAPHAPDLDTKEILFKDSDGSEFLVCEGWFGYYKKYVYGQKQGKEEDISAAVFTEYSKQAEMMYGKFENGKFTPGKYRRILPYVVYDLVTGRGTVEGYYDQDGFHNMGGGHPEAGFLQLNLDSI